MSPRKLSDSDRQKILQLYCQTEETTSSLATRYGVSSSTISRFLKSSLSESEYDDLIQAKRLARSSKNDNKEEKTTKAKKTSKSSTKSKSKSKSKSKKTKAKVKPVKAKKEEKEDKTEQLQLEIEEQQDSTPKVPTKSTTTQMDDLVSTETIVDQETDIQNQIEETDTKTTEDANLDLEEEEDLEVVQEVAAMFGEDLDEEDDDDEEDDEEDDGDEELIESITIPEKQLQVLSLNDAHFPRSCYLVIDRFSELVTKPMKDFAHLGSIPEDETQQKTLPIFDNHKVAKRFCDRKGKVIKVPDGRVLQKTSTYLQAKGISRILINGKVYSLA